MRMPHQAAGVTRGGWTGATHDDVGAAGVMFAMRAPIGGGGFGSFGGSACRLGCGIVGAACVAACAGLTGPAAAGCAVLCASLMDECRRGCPAWEGMGRRRRDRVLGHRSAIRFLRSPIQRPRKRFM